MTITWKHFPAGEHGFFRAPVLLTGERDALLIDGGFTLEDGRKLAAAIEATGKRLTTVYVSQSDPDYYFSLGAKEARGVGTKAARQRPSDPGRRGHSGGVERGSARARRR
jgi:glyoxylase-like metal-dependent hydrolase (beta-lactamase superfamily II)